MPILASAKKRVRVTARQTAENQLHRSRARTAAKKIRDLVTAGKAKEAAAALPVAQKYIDKAAKVRAIHPNAAARQKARLVAVIKGGGSGTQPVAKPKAKAKAAPKAASKKAASPTSAKATAGKKPAAKAKPTAKKPTSK